MKHWLGESFFYLKVSRPGLWFQTIWLYLLPTAQNVDVLSSPAFWIGFIFVCLPINLLAYGLNDLVDYDIDRHNIRKDSFLFGARGTLKQLKRVPLIASIVLLPFIIYFVGAYGQNMLYLMLGMILVNVIYNLPRYGLRSQPPLELINQLGYLLLLPFSILLNNTPAISELAILYLILFCTHSHLMGEIMDIYPDKASGRKTTATLIGIKASKAIVIALVFSEAVILWKYFNDWLLSSMLFAGVIWLLLDLFVLFKDRQYTRKEFTLFGIGLNLIGLSSMLWVWSQGTLT